MSASPRNLRSLPSIESLMGEPALVAALERLPRAIVVEAARAEVAAERERLARTKGAASAPAPEARALAERAAERASRLARPQLRRVLNATGVVLHTNLGRAPLPAAAQRAVAEVASGYSSLELDLDTGKRGDRGVGVERWLERLTGAESAMAVNNGAGAVLLVLSALAAGRGVVVSRGELVEIGGSFRVPEVMEKSGAKLIEVGSTNRTHLRDYERALARDGVAAILRVHRSNFRIDGFTTRPEPKLLAALARKHRVAFIEDLGSGALVELGLLGLEPEPTVRDSLAGGAEVVTFSGDKLLGGSQAGLIVGRRKWLSAIRRDPMARALRPDKLALAALEATLAIYADPARAKTEVPTLAMLGAGAPELKRRAEELAKRLEAAISGLTTKVREGDGEAGGGALPLRELPGWVVEVRVPGLTADELQRRARAADPPLLGIIRAGTLRLDPRTLTAADIDEAATALAAVWGSKR